MNQSLDSQSQKSSDTRLEAALAGEYSLSIKKIFDEAWEKTLGFKALYWEAMGICMLIGLGLILVGALFYVTLSIIMSPTPLDWHQWDKILEASGHGSLVMQAMTLVLVYIGLFITLPILAGMLMLPIRRVSNLPVRVGTIFNYYQKPWRYLLVDIWVTFLFQDVPTFLSSNGVQFLSGFVGSAAKWICIPLAITIGIYAYISYFFAMPLLADRKLSTWRALETSRKVVGRHWFDVCRTLFVIMLVTILIPVIVIILLASTVHWSMSFLAIIFIWLIPFSGLSIGILYREVMGVKESS